MNDLSTAELRAWSMEPVHVAEQERDLARRNAADEALASERDAYTARAEAAYARLAAERAA